MQRSTRSLAALGVAGLGLLALVFLGSTVGRCLGPLGVTAIQCARATGNYPTVGAGLPVLALSLLAAIAIAMPGLLRPVHRAALSELVGVGIAVVAYLAARPTTWTGATSTGEIITLVLPIDGAAVATAGILGAAVGLLGGRFLAGGRRLTPEP